MCMRKEPQWWIFSFFWGVIVDPFLSLGVGVSFELELKIMHVIRLDLFVVDFVLSISLSLKLLILLFAGLAAHGSLFLIIQLGICW